VDRLDGCEVERPGGPGGPGRRPNVADGEEPNLAEYAGVLIILALATALTVAMLVLQLRLGPKRDFDEKLEPFECGESPVESPRGRYAVRFFLVAILFVIFDVEAMFFYPWGAVFRELGMPGLVAIGVFTVPLVVGLVYEWKKGALEW